MKRTFAVNIAGYAFTIDENAYALLEKYLDTITSAFKGKDEGEEISQDIELRVAELLLEKISSGSPIVSYNDVEEVIKRIGTPDEFTEEEVVISTESDDLNPEISEDCEKKEEKIEETITPPPYYQATPKIKKKLFRDSDNAMLGGVCAGLAWYTGIDVTLLRLLTVLLIFLSASTVAIVYIVLWIVVPVARTPLQRMQMMGEDPTVENIGKTVTENFNNERSNALENTPRSGFSRFISSSLSVLAKIIFIFCLIIGAPVLLVIFFIFIICIFAFFVGGTAIAGGSLFGETFDVHAPGGGTLAFYLLLASAGTIITLGIPFWLFLRMAFKSKVKQISENNRRAILIIWLVGIALTAVFTVKTVKKAKQMSKNNWDVNIEKLEMLNELDGDDIDNIKINNGEVTLTTKEGLKYKVSKGKVDIETQESLEKVETITPDSTHNISVIEERVIENENTKDSIK